MTKTVFFNTTLPPFPLPYPSWTLGRHVHFKNCLRFDLAIVPTRPADVLLASLDSLPTAVDITIVHPLRPSGHSIAARSQPGVSSSLAETIKTTESAGPCAARNWLFRPFGMESTGALGTQATRLMKRAARSLSMRQGGSYVDAATFLFQGLHLALAKGRGEMLLACAPTS